MPKQSLEAIATFDGRWCRHFDDTSWLAAALHPLCVAVCTVSPGCPAGDQSPD
jgi:hypothetical protein